MSRAASKRVRLRKWATNRISGFLWVGVIDFFSELYMCIVFSVGINFTADRFTSAAVGFDNLFALTLTIAVVFAPILILVKLYKAIKSAEQSLIMNRFEQLEGGEDE